ncbi:MAG TPA: FHA domain-containing protein [Kofleriaceae bacterium]|nr:FHA domain-containing protein [Kofleriaceae bacterium]
MSKHNRNWQIVIGLVAAGLAMPGRVHADASSIEVRLEVKPPDPGNPKTRDDAPQIEATVIGAPNFPAEKFSLREDVKQAVEVKPISKREYTQGTEKLAIAIVMNGWELWIGNDDVLPEGDPSRFPGVLKSLEAALDKVSFKDAGPAGSLGMVITYADSATVRIAMGPLDRVTGSALGTQKDYFGTQGVELVKGVDLALSELHKVQVSRKVLVVICDGIDKNMEAAKGQMTALKARAAAEGIESFAIIYKGAMSGDGNVISAMIPQTQTVNTAENVATAIHDILSRLGNRQYLTFAGFDTALGVGLPWDLRPHNLILKVDKDDTDPVALTLAPAWHLPRPGFPWLLVSLIALGALVLVVIGVKVFSPSPQPLPPPLVDPVVAQPAGGPQLPGAPQPAGPLPSPGTVRIDLTGDGSPIVGWLVPLDGTQAFQTFKLRSKTTKIGTAPPCEIVITDGFMSSEHCQITASPEGFSLVDGGSTNGSYVNHNKIQGKYDLIDNDMITLGKTHIKFKSINS